MGVRGWRSFGAVFADCLTRANCSVGRIFDFERGDSAFCVWRVVSIFCQVPPIVANRRYFCLVSFGDFRLVKRDNAYLQVNAFTAAIVLYVGDDFLIFLLPPIIPTFKGSILSRFTASGCNLYVQAPKAKRVCFLHFE